MSTSAPGPDALLSEQAQVLEQIILGAPLRKVLAALCRIVETHAGTSARSAILLTDEDGLRLRIGAAPSLPDAYNAAIDGIVISSTVGTCCAAAATSQPVVTPDIATDPAWAELKHLPLAEGLVAAWSMPILSSTRRVLGTFGTYFLEAREPRPHERDLVEVLARTAALAIERDRADCTLRETARRHQFLSELDAKTQTLTEAGDVMAATARMLAEYLGVDRCAYAEVTDERVFVIVGDYTRDVPSIVGSWDVAAFGQGCVADMLAGRPFVVADTDADPRIEAGDLAAYRATTIRAVVCVPLHKAGRFSAAIAVHQKVPRHWTASEVELVSIVVARCWEAIERSRVSRELRDSEARYRTMVQATPECVKVVAADGSLLQMNAAGLRMIESSEAQALGNNVYEVVAAEHRERFREFNERVCDGTDGTLEFDIIGARGTRRSMETTAVALPAPSGGFVQLAISRDVTARVTATRALAESRARLDYAVRLSGVGFWYCDLPFSDLIWDVRCKDHFFLPPDAHINIELFYERIHPDDRELTREAIDSSIADHSSYDVIYRTVDPASGAIKFIRALGGTTYASDGTPTHFDGVTVDVTAQKLEEARLGRVAAAALQIHSAGTLEQILQAVTDQARTTIGAHVGQSSITTAAEPITSVSVSEMNAPFRGPDLGGADVDALVSQSNKPMRKARSKLGHRHGLLAAPFVGGNGANLGLIKLSDKFDGEFTAADEAILVQLAQLAAVAIENARLYAELRDQDRRKDEFLATLAHELRNPLAPIRTGLHVLQHGAEDPSRIHTMMERQLGHLIHIVDDLLDISRVTLGKVNLDKARVDLRTVIDSALETTRPLVEAGGHEIAVRLPSHPLPVDVDPTRMSQVFANLVNNAAKYTPAGGRIRIAVEGAGNDLLVRVSDTGVGIPREMLPRVFDMFTQVGRSIDRSQGGLGIGLTLVRLLVEMHGGAVEAESAGVNQGCCFTVRLPLAEPIKVESMRTTPVTGSPSSSLRVLIVDDNVDAAEMLSMLLEVTGNTTRMAHTGADALTEVLAFQPDVVFLDIGLPEMNGYEVAVRMRADKSLRQPVLVALTGWGSEEDRRQAHDAGFDRHMVKPISADKLNAVLAMARN